MKYKEHVIRTKIPENLDELQEWGAEYISNEGQKLGFRLAIHKIKELGLCPSLKTIVEEK